MERLRMSDDQRRILAIFIDTPPKDRLGILAATEYLLVISQYIHKTLLTKTVAWEDKDLNLMVEMACGLRKGASEFTQDRGFWDKVEDQLSKIHPDLKAR
jgi:hypothetical protein